MQFFNISVVLIVTISYKKNIQFGAKFNYKPWASEKDHPRNVYQIRENSFDKLDFFGFKYTSKQKFVENLAVIDFELIYFEEETFKDTNTTTGMSLYLYLFTQRFLMNHFSFVTLILIT